MKTSKLTCGSAEKMVTLSDVTHPYRLTGDDLCESTGSVTALDLDPGNSKDCESVVKEMASMFSQNTHGISGYYKIAWELAKVMQGSRGQFLRDQRKLNENVSDADIDKAFQGSSLKVCGMLDSDPVIGQTPLGKVTSAISKLSDSEKLKAIADLQAQLGLDNTLSVPETGK